MIWDILEAKIEQAGLGVAGQTLFRNTMPHDAPVCIMLRAPLSGIKIDHYLPGYYKPLIQAIVRHHDPVDGSRLAQAVSDTLEVSTEELHPATAERGRVRIIKFLPRELPIQYPRLDGNGIEWSLNFETAFNVHRL